MSFLGGRVRRYIVNVVFGNGTFESSNPPLGHNRACLTKRGPYSPEKPSARSAAGSVQIAAAGPNPFPHTSPGCTNPVMSPMSG
eukprot:4490216-Amphidinium_carterae.1